MIDANITYVEADADRDSADSGLASAEERLSELVQPAPEDDLYQAEQATEAARASHAAAVAKLDELRAAPGAEDIYQAEQAVEAATASHTAAVARLDELQAVPGKDDVYQAGQAVEAAMAGHAAADETGPMAILPWSSRTVGLAKARVSRVKRINRLRKESRLPAGGVVVTQMRRCVIALLLATSLPASYDEGCLVLFDRFRGVALRHLSLFFPLGSCLPVRDAGAVVGVGLG